MPPSTSPLPTERPWFSCAIALEIQGNEEELVVNALHGVDRVSELFRFEVDLSSSATLQLEDLVGAKAKIVFRAETLPDGAQPIHGIVQGMELVDVRHRGAVYRATVVPAVYPLTQRAQCRIFNELDAVAITKKVLSGAGFSDGEDFQFQVQGALVSREYTVQFQESDWDFCQRLWEDEGLFYYFAQGPEGAKLIVGREAANHRPIEGEEAIHYRALGAGLPSGEYLAEFTERRELRTQKLSLRDWDFNRQPTPTEGESGDGALLVEEYPGGHLGVAGEARTRAKHRLEAIRTDAHTHHGQSNSPRLLAGHTLQVTEHPQDALNGRVTLVEVTHTAELTPEETGDPLQAHSYGNSFRALPAALAIRPARKTPRPRILGIQTAIVVGPSGDEIHVDSLGRVKVQFHWDRRKPSEKNTLPVRVAQIWGSAKFGAVFIPRIGMEVVVAFEDGDPDRPLIVGTVYHAAGPIALPGDKTISGLKTNSTPKAEGANELYFQDKKDEEMFTVVAQKDLETTVKNDETRDVANDQSITIGHDRTLNVAKNETIDIGENQTTSVGKSQAISIGKDLSVDVSANRTESVGKNADESIGGASTASIGKDLTIDVGKNAKRTVGENAEETISKNYIVKAKKIQIEATDELILKVGDVSLTFVKSGKATLKVDKDLIVDTGGAVKIKTDADFEVKASGKANIKASGDVILKGSKVAQN